MSETLRPVERRVLAMAGQGHDSGEIARRLKCSPGHVERMMAWTKLPRIGSPARTFPRPLERRVLALRAEGVDYEEIGSRFNKSPGFIRRVDGLAHYQMALALLTEPDSNDLARSAVT